MNPKINSPDFWRDEIPSPDIDSHKYARGMAAVYAAPAMTGATRLAATAAARIGAGLVNVLAEEGVADVYRCALPAHVIVRPPEWNDPRVTARLYGSGGLPAGVRLRLDRPTVFDASALSALPENLHENIVLTPHEGEFAKTFPDLVGGGLASRAMAAARRTGACIVLKGPRTMIVHPDGRMVENGHASPYLATAGSGDVLSGMITGLLAQGMDAFSASCAAVWLHGECALRFGPGLVAEDLPGLIPGVLKEVLGFSAQLR